MFVPESASPYSPTSTSSLSKRNSGGGKKGPNHSSSPSQQSFLVSSQMEESNGEGSKSKEKPRGHKPAPPSSSPSSPSLGASSKLADDPKVSSSPSFGRKWSQGAVSSSNTPTKLNGSTSIAATVTEGKEKEGGVGRGSSSTANRRGSQNFGSTSPCTSSF